VFIQFYIGQRRRGKKSNAQNSNENEHTYIHSTPVTAIDGRLPLCHQVQLPADAVRGLP
jgi:23S rRNA maturation mini-RNase III